MRPSSTLLFLFASALLALSACSDDSDSNGGAGSAGAPASGGSAGTGGTAGQAGSAGSAGQAGAAGSTAGGAGAAGGTVGPVASCSEIPGSADCFANLDCPADRRCDNAGTETEQVPCCVIGPRGTGTAGSPCTLEKDCESAVCVDGLCSKDCTSEADCPDSMKQCIPIAFSGSDKNWCLPK